MNRKDRQLGMDRDISRRDFIHDLGIAGLGLSVLGSAAADNVAGTPSASVDPAAYYPPTLTGLRGSQPGAEQAAHALAREGKRWATAPDIGGEYDLIVVGGGISGLASAYFYRGQNGPGSRILILDNQDDFGGHARRNEFHQGGEMRLAWGGTVNIKYDEYSEVGRGLLAELGVDVKRLQKNFEFAWLESMGLQAATWFDAESYGRDALVLGTGLTDDTPENLAARVDEFPLSAEARLALRRFLTSDQNLLQDLSWKEQLAYVQGTSYRDFLVTRFAIPQEAVQIFTNATLGYWGVRADDLSIIESIGTGLPGAHVLGDFAHEWFESEGGRTLMFPDGNASIARLLVRALIPAVAPDHSRGKTRDDIVTAAFDYAHLDQPDSSVRLRLNATVVNVRNQAETDDVGVTYVHDGAAHTVTAGQCVLACYNRIIPHLAPEISPTQAEALRYSVRRPLLVINTLLRNGNALKKLDIASAYCPGRMVASVFLAAGVNVGDYRPGWDPEKPAVMQFFGTQSIPVPEGMNVKDQHRAGRQNMLATNFADYEREVRTVLTGVLGGGGFDAAEDILAITVNRWPHGYAYDHLDLWDPDWAPGEAPHEIGRKRFGNIAIANSDAGADAYTHTAIDQAWRAVTELAETSV